MTTAQRHRDASHRQQPSLFDSVDQLGHDARDNAGTVAKSPTRAAVKESLTAGADVVGATDGHFAESRDMVTDQGPASRNQTYAVVRPDHQAARSKWYGRILSAGRRGVTLDELAARYNCPPNAISGRITELHREGLVIRTAARRPTRASTPDRRITAAVIVAAQFLRDEPSRPKD